MKFNNTVSKVMICSVAAALSLTALPAAAEQENPRLTVAFISDAAQGRTINREQYDRAIEKLEDTGTEGIRGFYAANNLCVSYLKAGKAEKAQAACETAVTRIQLLMNETPRVAKNRVLADEYSRLLAIALSNRGVINFINDKPDLARDDFEAAIETGSYIREAQINLARLSESA